MRRILTVAGGVALGQLVFFATVGFGCMVMFGFFDRPIQWLAGWGRKRT